MTQQVVTTAGGQVVQANPRRKSLLLLPASNQSCFISDTNPPALNIGMPLNQGTIGVLLTYERFGELITGNLYGISAVQCTIGIVEGFDAD